MTRPEPGAPRYVTTDDLARMPWTVRRRAHACRFQLLHELELERPHRDRENPEQYQARMRRHAERIYAELPTEPEYVLAARRAVHAGPAAVEVRRHAEAILAALPAEDPAVAAGRRAVLATDGATGDRRTHTRTAA